MSKRVGEKSLRTRIRLVTLGPAQLAVVTAGVFLVLTVAAVLVYPELYVQYIQRFGIREFEAHYGFRTGAVQVHFKDQQPETQWGIVWVAPDGAFARLGLRAADIPFAYHGGVTDMYGALKQASSGQPSSFQVYNASDAYLGRPALHDVNLPAVVQSRAAPR
jgi:hypothetical protein